MFIADVTAVHVDESYMDKNNSFHLNDSNLLAYSHGSYFGLGNELGTFGYSIRKKKAAAQSNRNALALPADKAEAIIRACDEVIRGCFADEFIVDAIQGGAGTSANMNMNEVLANRANEWMGGRKGDYSRIHPNDHVNMSQSTNDVIPTAGKLTVLELLKPLLAELDGLERELRIKAAEFDGILKMGRTQLQDAVPMRLGQTFHAYATMVKRDYERLKEVRC